MSREIRRVPLDWKHPTEPNPYWREQQAARQRRGDPKSRLHGPTERFVPLLEDYPGAVEGWEKEGRDLAARTGNDWTFRMEWHLTGYDDCSCHPRRTGTVHPWIEVDDDGEEEAKVTVQDADHLHEILTAEHQRHRPDPADYMPVFDTPEDQLGWCLYQTVSEGSPVTPVFATAEELIEHLCTVGQDWDQKPMSRAAATALVTSGWAPSAVGVGGQIYTNGDALLAMEGDPEATPYHP